MAAQIDNQGRIDLGDARTLSTRLSLEAVQKEAHEQATPVARPPYASFVPTPAVLDGVVDLLTQGTYILAGESLAPALPILEAIARRGLGVTVSVVTNEDDTKVFLLSLVRD